MSASDLKLNIAFQEAVAAATGEAKGPEHHILDELYNKILTRDEQLKKKNTQEEENKNKKGKGTKGKKNGKKNGKKKSKRKLVTSPSKRRMRVLKRKSRSCVDDDDDAPPAPKPKPRKPKANRSKTFDGHNEPPATHSQSRGPRSPSVLGNLLVR